MRTKQQITHVAIIQDGVTYSLAAPARHHNVIRMMVDRHNVERVRGDAEQGFLLEDGTFVRREAAAYIAVRSGQIKNLKWPPNLYSEDLW